MAETEKHIKFTTVPPDPEHLEFTQNPFGTDKPYGVEEDTDEAHSQFGFEVGIELIDGLAPAHRRIADSVDVATGALVLINMDIGCTFRRGAFMHGIVRAMDEKQVWGTSKGPQSPLVW